MPRKHPTPDPAFGLRVRELCTEKQLSLAELARRSDLSPGVLRRIVSGTRPAQPAERRSIARALGAKVQELARKKVADRDLAAEVATRRQVEQERDALREQVDGLRAELTAERAARSAEIAELRASHELEAHAQAGARQELDALRERVQILNRELAAERAARTADLAELRDKHMRQVAVLRSDFHAEQVKTLGEAQEREEKLAAALHFALDEVDRRSRAASARPPAHTGSTPHNPLVSPAPPTAPAGSNSSFADKLATMLAGVAGVGGVVFRTWLLTSKQP